MIRTISRIYCAGNRCTATGLRHRVAGLALAGTRGFVQVEISTDGGERWTTATLDTPLSPSSWVFWHYDWTAQKAARYTLIVRAMDGTGKLQTSIEQDPAPDGATGLHEITVTVEG